VKNLLTIFSIVAFFYFTSAQDFNVNSIPEELKENAYAVVRLENTSVEFLNYNNVLLQEEIVVTVLNESGLKFAQIPVYYNGGIKTKRFEAAMYDANGSEIRKFKKRDVKDVSIYDGFSLFTDSRVQYFDIVPVAYPFTIRYNIELNLSNTFSLPGWNPVGDYNLSVEKSVYKLNNPAGIPIRKLEEGFEGWPVENHSGEKNFFYSIENIPATEDEAYSPSLSELTPSVRIAPTEFEMEGIRGKIENWKDFGKWYYDNLLFDKRDLPESEKQKARELVEGIADPVEKARILYQYMQTKTRYINISIGIGGLEPFPASYVNSKSYGDCKALSNYMISLLEAVGITAYHTAVYGERSRKEDFTKDFAVFQGNHMIVNVPIGNDTIWLECTSQQTAFNYLGSFTDDRYALSVMPEGGKIVKTQSFPAQTNKELITGKGEILPNGNLKASFSVTDSGLQYDRAYGIYFEGSQEQKRILNKRLSNFPNLNIENYEFENDRTNAVFIADLQLESKQFAKIYGNNMAINLVPMARMETGLKKDNSRKYPVEIRFGFTDQTEFELKIPTGYSLNEKFEPLNYESEFGNYLLEVDVLNPQTLLVKRNLLVKDGVYPKEKFNDYVEFRRKISSFDNAKILLEKK